MVRHGWDWNALSAMVSMGWLFSHDQGNIWHLIYISTPRLGVLESPNHNCSILTVPMSHCMYVKWWGTVYIGTHCLQWSPWAAFSIMVGEKLSLISVHFNTKIGCLGVPNHNCSTLTVPMSHYMYIKWQGMVETGMHCLQWSPRDGFSVMDGRNSSYDLNNLTQRLDVLESPNHNCSTLTVLMSSYMYVKWWGMVETGMHYLQWSPWAAFSVMDGEKLSLISVHFITKIGCLGVPKP